MPDWARSTFNGFLDDVQVLSEVVQLTTAGISMIRATPKAIRALHFTGKPDFSEDQLPDEVKGEIKYAEHRAALAQREVDSDFALIHSQAVLSLWSALEDVIRDLVARWLMNLPQTRLDRPWSDLKVRVGEYEQLDEEQKAYFLVGAVEQSTAAALKVGINRFECMLESLRLSGALEEQIGALIYEMQQVRNVVAHRRGIADARFCAACPTFGTAIGQRVLISHERWRAYEGAIHSYILEVIFRTGERFGDHDIRERSTRAARRGEGPD
jgi:hypothetical protein